MYLFIFYLLLCNSIRVFVWMWVGYLFFSILVTLIYLNMMVFIINSAICDTIYNNIIIMIIHII